MGSRARGQKSTKLTLDRPVEAVARLTLVNPAKRNPIDHDLLASLYRTLNRLCDGGQIRCLVITGAGRVFSSGYDISDLPDRSFATEAEALVAHPFHPALHALSAFPFPTIAAINGHCLGGALELAIRCDLRVAAKSAKLGMPPAKLGLIYGHTGLKAFLDVIGVARTKQLFLTGRSLTADRAEQIGLLHEVVQDRDLESASLALASNVASNAPMSARGNKLAIETLVGFPRLTPAQEEELVELRRSCFSSADLREGVRAFNEKRAPRWSGR